MISQEPELQTFMPTSQELLDSVPPDSWIVVSSDRKRIVAYGDSIDSVIDRADALGEKDYVIDRAPGAMLVL